MLTQLNTTPLQNWINIQYLVLCSVTAAHPTPKHLGNRTMKIAEHIKIKANSLPKFNFQILNSTSDWIFNNRRKQNQNYTHPQQSFLQTKAGTHQKENHVSSVKTPVATGLKKKQQCLHTPDNRFWHFDSTYAENVFDKLRNWMCCHCTFHIAPHVFLNITIQFMSFNSNYSFNGIKWDKILSHIKKGIKLRLT